MKAENLLDNLPAHLPEELLTTIFQANNLRIERIVFQGHTSPPGFWFDQEENELAIVLEGGPPFNLRAVPNRLNYGAAHI